MQILIKAGPHLAGILLLFASAATAIATQDGARRVSGTVLAKDNRSITIAGSSIPGGSASFRVEPTITKVLIARYRGDASTEAIPAPIADIALNSTVTIEYAKDVATAINVHPPLPVDGEILSLEPDGVTVVSRHVGEPGPKPPSHFEIATTTSIVRDSYFGGQLAARPAELKRGEHVVVTGQNGAAVLIRICLPDPVRGVIKAVCKGTLAIQSVGTRQKTALLTLAIDPDRTQVLKQYFGSKPERVSVGDLEAGQVVAIYPTEGRCDTIVVEVRPIRGQIVSIASDRMTVRVTNGPLGQPPVMREVKLTGGTEVFLGKILNSFRLPDGRTAAAFTFPSPDGHLSDLKIGESVFIIEKDGTASEIRIRPEAAGTAR